jgi:2-polyprenyl-3-methyl-5-hydroxy-6-metoxy-1,4-benzoquinol methylase
MSEARRIPATWHTERIYPRLKQALDWACRDAIGKQLLDVGSNDGTFGISAKKRGFYVVGLDKDPAFSDICSWKLDAFWLLDVTRNIPWPLDDESFDVVHIGAVIEHVYDFHALFSEAYRVLRPGGVVIISTPNLAHYRHRIELLLGKAPIWYSPQFFQHIRMWTFRDLAAVLEEHGFTVIHQVGMYEREGRIYRVMARLFPTFAPIIMVEAAKRRGNWGMRA